MAKGWYTWHGQCISDRWGRLGKQRQARLILSAHLLQPSTDNTLYRDAQPYITPPALYIQSAMEDLYYLHATAPNIKRFTTTFCYIVMFGDSFSSSHKLVLDVFHRPFLMFYTAQKHYKFCIRHFYISTRLFRGESRGLCGFPYAVFALQSCSPPGLTTVSMTTV